MAGAAPADSDQQQRAFTNTILALSASTIVTYVLSPLLSTHGKLRPVDLQNATLAGGVAIGCTSNLSIGPFAAMVIGIAAGVISAYGYNVIQPWLENRVGLYDSCGIHNLHAMPSVVGAIASAVVASNNARAIVPLDGDLYGLNVGSQWWRQYAAIVVCIGFAVVSGFITGHILKWLYPTNPLNNAKHFHDDVHWEVAEDYNRTLDAELPALLSGNSSNNA